MHYPKPASKIAYRSWLQLHQSKSWQTQLIKLTSNQATQILKHPQCDPICIEVQDNLSFIIIFSYGPYQGHVLCNWLIL